MKIKQPKPVSPARLRDRLPKPGKGSRPWMRWLGVLLYTGLVFSLGAWMYRSGLLRTTVEHAGQSVEIVSNRMRAGLFAAPMQLQLDIKHTPFQKLAYKRQEALRTGILMAAPDDFVPATLQLDGESIPVKIRLKGDWTDHLQQDKWSFRVQTRDEHTVLGMKQFSLQHPETRNYLSEWLYHKALDREDVLSLRYHFVDLVVNGKDWGIYALEEHFEKRLLEHHRRREGPILRFDEDLLWMTRQNQWLPFPTSASSESGSFLSSAIDAFQSGNILTDSTLLPVYQKAITLLDAFRRGLKPTHDVFDVEKMARFFALADVLGAQHSVVWHNLRFYFNPITARFEPIGFDAQSGRPVEQLAALPYWSIDHTDPLIDPNGYGSREALFQDQILFKAYLRTLERVSEPAYLDTLLTSVADDLRRNLDILHLEFPTYRFPTAVFYRNQAYVRSMLQPAKGLHAYWAHARTDTLYLQLGNLQRLPLDVLDLVYRDSLHFAPLRSTLLSPKALRMPVQYQTLGFEQPVGLIWADSMIQDLSLSYRITGTQPILTTAVYAGGPYDATLLENDVMRQASNIEVFDFLAIDETTRRIRIKPGSWTLTQNLILPAGYTVISGPDTQIDLINQALILSYSPLSFEGTEEQPIRIFSSDSTGQGLVVMQAESTSRLQHTVFHDLHAPNQGNWTLTGAVTFYESPVIVSNSRFVNNPSEDALNVIRSRVQIESSLFQGGLSDAFDGDFVEGRIASSQFVNPGNDAIDISGSVLMVEDVTITGAGDKGLSAGELSEMTVRRTYIGQSQLAAASKDLSTLTITGLEISNCQYGLAAYLKKSEFGPGALYATGLTMESVDMPYLVGDGATVEVQGRAQTSEAERTRTIIATMK